MLFALQSITAGEEITYDYCINGSGDTLWERRCGSACCRILMHSDFFHLPLFDIWYAMDSCDCSERHVLLWRQQISLYVHKVLEQPGP